MKLVTLSGLDGSGKSTQIELLKDYLGSQDKTFFYFHGPTSSISSLYNFLPIFSWKKYRKRDKNASVAKAKWIEIQLRKIALLIDVCRFKRLMKKTDVDYIISDRYFYDTVVNINFLSGKNKKLCVEKHIPRPDSAFFIRIRPEIIMHRDRKPDQGMEYLLAKEKLFESRIKGWDMLVVDGEKSKSEIFEFIRVKFERNGEIRGKGAYENVYGKN
ncbi:MAG TPA: hypothetical protein VK254_03605 [Candidatus Bathyarchaeia archaeon]|nr:hypothetical protein [Candidatus Bathyarchaeia archaeon]